MKALIFSRSETLAPVIQKCLESGDFRTFVYHPRIDRFLLQYVRGAIEDFSPDVIVIDSQFSPGDLAKLEYLASLSLIDLRRELDQIAESKDFNAIPGSLLLLVAVTAEKPGTVPCFYFLEGPTTELTQELLNGGTDWVWKGRDMLGGSEHRFAAVVERLKQLRGASTETRTPN